MKIGVDVGGSHIAAALVNEKGEIVKKIEKDTPKNVDIEKYLIEFLDNSIDELKKQADINYIGMGIPGTVDGGTIISNLTNVGIKYLDLKILEEKHKIKVYTINDAKAATLAEKKYGAMKNYKDGVFFCLGTGVGGGVFVNGKLLKARKNPGFEMGHIIIDKNGEKCECGKTGCLEAHCSIKRFKDKIVEALKKINIDTNKLEPKNLPKVIKENMNNTEIQNIINVYIDDLIIGLSSVIDVFEPEVICFGGSFVYFKEVIFDKFVEEMNSRKYFFNENAMPDLVLAELKNDAGIIGATLIDEM